MLSVGTRKSRRPSCTFAVSVPLAGGPSLRLLTPLPLRVPVQRAMAAMVEMIEPHGHALFFRPRCISRMRHDEGKGRGAAA